MEYKKEVKSFLFVVVMSVTVLFAVGAFGYSGINKNFNNKRFAVLKEREIKLAGSGFKKRTTKNHFYDINRIENLRSSVEIETKDRNYFGQHNDQAYKAKYLPYLQGRGGGSLRSPHHGYVSFDLFIPLWQRNLADLVFSDLRVYDKMGGGTEGNFHLGYRHLFGDSEQILGVFGGFDRRKTPKNNFFNQVMLGGEYWYKKFFIGVNGYQPVGSTTKFVGFKDKKKGKVLSDSSYRSITIIKDKIEERAMWGVDFELGYEVIEGLVAYAGGYYFAREGVDSIYGPKLRLTYDWFLNSDKGLFSMIDKVGLEAGFQNGKVRGSAWYLSANIRLDLWFKNEKELSGILRHMVDPVRRDIDVNTGEAIQQIESNSLMIKKLTTENAIYESIRETDLNIIDLSSVQNLSHNLIEELASNKNLIFVFDGVNDQHIAVLLNKGSSQTIYVFLGRKKKEAVQYDDEDFMSWWEGCVKHLRDKVRKLDARKLKFDDNEI